LGKVARKYAPDSKVIDDFFREIDSIKQMKKKSAEEEEKKRKREEEKKRLRERAERLKERTSDVTETIIKKSGKEVKVGRNKFFNIDYWREKEIEDNRYHVVEVKLNGRKKKEIDVKKLREYIKERFDAGKRKFEQGFYQEALLEYEKAYLRALAYNRDDIRARYNLVLIYNKLGERLSALNQFVKLVDSINRLRIRSGNDRYFKKINDTVYCWILGTIIHAAFLGYNASRKNKMSRQTFVVSKLVRDGYLNFGNHGKKIKIKLSDPYGEDREISYFMKKIACPSGGKYRINRDGRVVSSIHGVSPMITVKYEFDKLGVAK